MGCQPVQGDNPRVLESGLSYVQVDKRVTSALSIHIKAYGIQNIYGVVRTIHTVIKELYRHTAWCIK